MSATRCPYCGSRPFIGSQVFRCGYVDGHVRTDRCLRNEAENDAREEDEIDRRKLDRHFGDQHAEGRP